MIHIIFSILRVCMLRVIRIFLIPLNLIDIYFSFLSPTRKDYFAVGYKPREVQPGDDVLLQLESGVIYEFDC